MSRRKTLASMSVAMVGVALGVGATTFHYAEGTSYLSKEPRACTNCHIMQSQFDSWQKASHHTVASCVDCHLPEHFPHNYIAKARNGWNHSRAFTLQDFPEPILITAPNAAILQDNCVRCHGDVAHALVAGQDDGARRCVACHVAVGHGEQVGLGGPLKAAERRAVADHDDNAKGDR